MKTRSSCGLSCEISEPIVGAAALRGGAFHPRRPGWCCTAPYLQKIWAHKILYFLHMFSITLFDSSAMPFLARP